MKLLIDANLSPKLARRLTDVLPGSLHILELGFLSRTPDLVIWEYAKANGFTILTADSDFLKLAWQRGTPPKVIRIERCDFKTVIVERLLRGNAIRLAQFEESDQGTLKLSLG